MEIKIGFWTPADKGLHEDKLKNDDKHDELKRSRQPFPDQENSVETLKNITVKKEDSLDPYDLDLQISNLATATLPSDPAQSEWSRCSCHCQTARGHTCGGCDTQQNAYTCVRC